MDKHQKFALLCLGIICAAMLILPNAARADYEHEPSNSPSYQVAAPAPVLGPFPTIAAACQAVASYYTGFTGSTHSVTGVSTSLCSWKRDSTGQTGSGSMTAFVAPACHVGDTVSASTGNCIHPGDPEPDPESCDIPSGQLRYNLVVMPPTIGYSPDLAVCYQNCQFDYVDTFFFDNGDLENKYSNTASDCGSELPSPPSPWSYIPTQPDPDQPCYNVIGWVNGSPVCGDKADQCKASGGSYGFVNGVEVCIPKAENPPTCPARTVLTIGPGGVESCVPIGTDPPEDPPPQCDDDKDCDGTTDGDDPDGDGDGRPDGPVTYTGDGACDPTDKDYAFCQGNLQNISDQLDDGLEAKARGSAFAEGELIREAGLDAIGNGESAIAAPGGIGERLANALGIASGDCVDVSIDVLGHAWGIQCSQTAPIRTLLAYVFAVLTLISVFNIAIQRVPE